MWRYLPIVCSLVMSWSAVSVALDEPEKIASIEGVTEYRLSNGARVLLFPEPSRPTFTVNMTVLVGSRHEGYGEAGMAHLLEHMVFKGTPTFPDIPKALRDHGASFNGTTNSDRTNYFETLPATDENLEFAIHLESDRLVNSFIKREDLMSEFSVVRSEFERGENSPQAVLAQRVQSAAFEWHNYGKSTIGNRSDIERVPIENLQAFYRNYYQPDNVVLIITGRFEEARALELVQRYLGSIPKPTRTLNTTYTEEPPQDGERLVVLRRVGDIGYVTAAYHMPAAAHEDWAPLSMLASVLTEDKVGRLEQLLVESKLATSVSARSDNSHDPGLFFVAAQPAEGKLDEVRDVLLQAMEGLDEVTFTDEQVERAKRRAYRSTEQLFSNAASMAQALSSAASLGDWRLLFVQRDRIQQVTSADVNRVARTYFRGHNRTVGMFIPADAPQRMVIPAVASIEAVVRDYKGGEAYAAGEAFDPTPENIDLRTMRFEADGIKVALLPKRNRGETVSMTVTLRYGNEESLLDRTTAASLLGGMLMAGTKNYDRQALQEQMTELGVRINTGGMGGGRRGGGGGRGGGGLGTAGQLTVSVEAKRSSLAPAIRLMGEILREPAFPEDEFEQTKSRLIAGLRMMATEPAMLAANELSRALSKYPPDDVRYVPTTEEMIRNIESATLEQLRDIYRQQLSSQKVEIAIVGEFEPTEALDAIFEALKDWNTDAPIRDINREAVVGVPGSKNNILTPDKANATFMAGLAFPMNDLDDDAVPLQIGNFILGGGTLSSRLGDRIRQREGLSYGVTSSITIPSKGNDARFTINAICNPVNIDAVETAALEELRRFVNEGPTEAELEDAKKAWLESQKVGRSADAALAGQMVSQLDLNRSFEFVRQRERQVERLTTDVVRDAFRRHVDPDKLVIIRAGDF